MTATAIIAFFALALLAMPLAFALGLAAFGGIIAGDVEWHVLPQRMMHAVNSFPLLAIPCFMLAGELMVEGGIMEKLVALANSVVGRVRGGLGHVTVVSAASLSAISGTAVADATALASTLGPSLAKYYGNGFGAAVVAAAANLGPIIPPSAAMIVYAYMAGPSVSVGALFMAGFVPGLVMAAAMMLLIWAIARKRGYPHTGERFSVVNVLVQLKRSFLIVLMPIVVVGGIVGGAFTATEGSAIAVVYALLVGLFVTRQLKLSDLPNAMFRAAITTGVVAILIAFASAVTFLLSIDLVPQKLTAFLQLVTRDPLVFIWIVMAVLMFVGMFLESNAAYIMLVPLLAPIAELYGIDPLHFGFVFILNLVIGMLTPPVGVLLFVVSSARQVPLNSLLVNVWPFIVCQFAVLVLCIVFPPIVTWLPRQLGY
ncbi:MAG: TRAP transporter large permease [Alphaproteobacteria bacterium]|nr:TRAP transporter large permease [Alphaproteobacteria bacterium]